MRLRTSMRRTAAMAALLAAASALPAQENPPGRTGALFLTLPVDARSAALGGARCGLSDDAFGAIFNPAAARLSEDVQLGLSHTFWFDGFYYEALAGTVPLERVSLVFHGVHFGDTAEVDLYDGQDVELGEPYEMRDLCFSAGLAWSLGQAVTMGVAAKVVRTSLVGDSAMAIAADVGIASHDAAIPGFSFGASLRNLGYTTSYRGGVAEPDSLPKEARFGVAYTILGRKPEDPFYLALAAEGILPSYYDTTAVLGAEFSYRLLGTVAASLRVAYHYPEDGGWLAGLTAGGGLEVLRVVRAGVDYALTMHETLGMTHHISVRYRI